MSKIKQMNILTDLITGLSTSPLYQYRVDNAYVPVIGEGSLDAQIMFIGEAPGKDEALTGKPFCGASGKVLNQLLEHISVRREDVYITNIVKDRPQDNRDPKPQEIELYAPFLIQQFEIIKPKVIATLGRFSTEYIMNHFDLTDSIKSISKIAGTSFCIKTNWGEVRIVPLYHPAVAVYNRNRLDELKKHFEILLGRSDLAPTEESMIQLIHEKGILNS